MRVPFVNRRKGGRPRLKPVNNGLGPLVQKSSWDIAKSLKKVNWTNVWRIKNISREEIMTEALQQLVREFEEKMTVIFQQLVKESEGLKHEVRELQRTCEMLRAENSKMFAQNLKLKNGILHASESMKDFLQAIAEEADEAAVEEAGETAMEEAKETAWR